ncbi:class I SAM-dependent methyltransferase [Patescibacteria group bacterium]|nr:class I SAM-dependent methyltransferase [Patescibacteria group bacterium]
MPISEELLNLICDPDNGLNLSLSGETLINAHTRHSFEIKNGIPLLYSSKTNKEHIAEETKLAVMMKRRPSSQKDAFSLNQWKKSKQEFWHIVKKNIKDRKDSENIINIGCGYDDQSQTFEKSGHTFVNFDLLYEMLLESKNIHNGRNYIAGDVNHLPFQKEKFGIAICIDLIHHEYNRVPQLLESFSQIIKPGGVLFLEDPNAWALFQIPKSLLLPKPLYRFLRSALHRIKHSAHHPAEYEFPTSVFKIKKILKKIGFNKIIIHPSVAYPGIGPIAYTVYHLISLLPFVKKYFNYHYIIEAHK